MPDFFPTNRLSYLHGMQMYNNTASDDYQLCIFALSIKVGNTGFGFQRSLMIQVG